MLFADRTSCHHCAANQFRLLLSSFAYVLLYELRATHLAGTDMATAQVTKNRLISSEDRGSRDAVGSPSRAAPVLKLPLPERVPPRRVHADPHA